jgi:hypothetical protein
VDRARLDLAEEIADVVTYALILTELIGMDLGTADCTQTTHLRKTTPSTPIQRKGNPMTTILNRAPLDGAIKDLETNKVQWTKGWGDRKTRTCAHGAILRPCDTPGDAIIWSRWVSTTQLSMSDNDAAPDASYVVNKLKAVVDPTEADMEKMYGPQWAEVISLIRRAATLTAEEREALRKAYAYDVASSYAAYDAAYAVASSDASYDAAVYAEYAAYYASYAAHAYVASRAARGIAMRHLIGTHGYTQAHYDALVGPWFSVVGK